jgi:hypothetical protein
MELTSPLMNHEEAAVKAFIRSDRQQRYLRFLKNPTQRSRFTSELAHFKALDPKCLVAIPPNQQNASSVAELLATKGAGSRCWVISVNSVLDSRELDLREALDGTIGRGMGTIISCVAGKLGYFEDEDVKYILQRQVPSGWTTPG